VRIVFISDTHNQHDTMRHPVPDGDILIHAGDATMLGRVGEIGAFAAWFRSLPHPHKIFVAGNHDWMFQRNPSMAKSLLNNGIAGGADGKILYLEDSGTEVMGLSIYGSPWQPTFFDWAFNLDRGAAIARKWDLIPDGLDILITHGPPINIHDQISPHLGSEHLGCEELLKAVEQKKPKIHVYGHIHGGYGHSQYVNTLFINAAICTEEYKPLNAPIVIEWNPGEDPKVVDYEAEASVKANPSIG
jgi:predicted phosphohydrolase